MPYYASYIVKIAEDMRRSYFVRIDRSPITLRRAHPRMGVRLESTYVIIAACGAGTRLDVSSSPSSILRRPISNRPSHLLRL